MILLLKRLNILIALIFLFLTLGIIKFKNNLSHDKAQNFNVDAIVVLYIVLLSSTRLGISDR